jgi:hypothetical protein
VFVSVCALRFTYCTTDTDTDIPNFRYRTTDTDTDIPIFYVTGTDTLQIPCFAYGHGY